MTELSGVDQVKAQYQQAFQEHGPTVSALFFPKGRQEDRFASLCRAIGGDGFSLLDYGCGLADLYGFLARQYRDFRYSGVDLVPEFINEARQRYPQALLSTVGSVNEIEGHYDYVLAAGVFNLLYDADLTVHRNQVFETLRQLFARAGKALMVNFMTDQVDFQQPGSYHQNVKELYDFASRELSPRLLIDQSYMPYEYSLLVFKDATILRPDNIYAPLT